MNATNRFFCTGSILVMITALASGPFFRPATCIVCPFAMPLWPADEEFGGTICRALAVLEASETRSLSARDFAASTICDEKLQIFLSDFAETLHRLNRTLNNTASKDPVSTQNLETLRALNGAMSPLLAPKVRASITSTLIPPPSSSRLEPGRRRLPGSISPNLAVLATATYRLSATRPQPSPREPVELAGWSSSLNATNSSFPVVHPNFPLLW